MKITNVFAVLSLFLVCCFSVASAQVEITGIERYVYVHYYDSDDVYESISLEENSEEPGLFSEDLYLNVGNSLAASSQHTMSSSEDTQFSISGQMSATLVQSDPVFEDGLHSRTSLQAYFSTAVFCDYSLAGIVSGIVGAEFLIVNVGSGQQVDYDVVTDAEFSLVGQIPPGDYYFHVWIQDQAYPSAAINRNTEVDFDLDVSLEGTISEESITLGGIKALYR